MPVATATLGTAVILIEGWQRISRYNETWLGYRAASERMKRDQRLYGLEEDEAYLRFVETIEAIIAEEQQLYWQSRSSKPSAQIPSKQT